MVCINKNIPGRTVAEYYHDKKEHFKEYRVKNKDKIKERKKVRTICDCGLDVNKDHITRHKKTKRHLKLMESKTDILAHATLP